jgi:hypothetical protein
MPYSVYVRLLSYIGLSTGSARSISAVHAGGAALLAERCLPGCRHGAHARLHRRWAHRTDDHSRHGSGSPCATQPPRRRQVVQSDTSAGDRNGCRRLLRAGALVWCGGNRQMPVFRLPALPGRLAGDRAYLSRLLSRVGRCDRGGCCSRGSCRSCRATLARRGRGSAISGFAPLERQFRYGDRVVGGLGGWLQVG